MKEDPIITETSKKLAEALGSLGPVKLVCRKPTEAEIALHRAKLLMAGVHQGIEPHFSREYRRLLPPTA